jgi:hypothetical protein
LTLRLKRLGQSRLQSGRDLRTLVFLSGPLGNVQAKQENIFTLKKQRNFN